MGLGSIVDVAIGLIFAYALVSLVASAVQEVVAGIFKWRGKYLVKCIAVLTDNEPGTALGWGGVADWMKTHFGTLDTGALMGGAQRVGRADQRLASNGQAPLTGQQQTALQNLGTLHDHPLLQGTPTSLPSYVQPRDFSAALLDVLSRGSQAPLFSAVARGVNDLPDGDLKTTLSAFLNEAGGDADKLRDRIEAWFDNAMDRVAGVYKRFAQYALLALGLVLAVGLNVDTVTLVQTLSTTTAARQAVVAVSQAYVAQHPGKPEQSVHDALAALDQSTLAIGRHPGEGFFATATTRNADGTVKNPKGSVVFGRLLGWLLTAIAVSLGAPFWFDMLDKVVQIRNSGPPPASPAAAKQGA